ncbi:MAG TPA: hypothetical protein VGC89_12935 [Pyrinomonadaceae bacterium]|jgi:hypothetical protein
MSELGETLWAVVSERGCEAAGVKYTDALALMRRLTQEKVSGLCIVTATAARRFITAMQPDSQQPVATRTARRKA